VITTYKQGSDVKDSDVGNDNGPATTATFTLDPGVYSKNWDLGLYKCTRIAGDAWLDRDVDGIYDKNEKGVNNIKVYIVNALNKNIVDTIRTAAFTGLPSKNGYYISHCLKPGKYFVRFELGEFFGPSAPYKGGNPDKDSDITNENGPNTTKKLTLLSGDALLNIGAGLQNKATIGDGLKKDTTDINHVKVLVDVPEYSDDTTKSESIDSLISVILPEILIPGQESSKFNDSTLVADKKEEKIIHQTLIEWLKCNGYYNGNFVELNWETGEEINNDHFNVERKHESESEFRVIGFVPAHDTPDLKRHEYEFDNFEIVESGLYYYRIRQLDKSGNFNLSQIITIEVVRDNELNVFIYPNPVRDLMKLEMQLPSNTDVVAEIIDNTGSIVSTPVNAFKYAGTQDVIIRTTDLASGVYILRIQTNSGIIHKQFTVIK
jgi:hypothetical protein